MRVAIFGGLYILAISNGLIDEIGITGILLLCVAVLGCALQDTSEYMGGRK